MPVILANFDVEIVPEVATFLAERMNALAQCCVQTGGILTREFLRDSGYESASCSWSTFDVAAKNEGPSRSTIFNSSRARPRR